MLIAHIILIAHIVRANCTYSMHRVLNMTHAYKKIGLFHHPLELEALPAIDICKFMVRIHVRKCVPITHDIYAPTVCNLVQMQGHWFVPWPLQNKGAPLPAI